MSSISPLRIAAGVAAVAVLVAAGIMLPEAGTLRAKAVVEAAQTFSLTSIGPGRYQSVLQRGLPARGQGLVHQKVLRFERSDLVELTLSDSLRSGQRIEAGTRLASLHSPLNERRLAELEAERADLEAERALLAAGDTVEAVQLAKVEERLAEAERQQLVPELERSRALAEQGVVSQAVLDEVELQDRVRALRIEVARAMTRAATASARPEALTRIEAQISAVDAQIAEVTRTLTADLVTCPIDGLLEVGGNKVVLRVYDLDPAYLRIPVPEAMRSRIAVGREVRFVTTAAGEVFEGTVVDLSEDASDLNGIRVFWASAEVGNPDGTLRSGVTGSVVVPLETDGRSVVDRVLVALRGT